MKGITDQNSHTVPVPEAFPYLEAYQLTSPPFSSIKDSDSAFISDQWHQTLNQLSHLIQSSDLILAVSAENGMGKTTLSKLFMRHADKHLRCCPITATKKMDKNKLIEILSHCFNLPFCQNDQDLLECLLEQGNDLQRSDIIPVILLDNAQLLPNESLQLLLHFLPAKDTNQKDKLADFRILLLSTPELITRLEQLQTNLHVIPLEPMDRDTTKDYLLHRLKQKGMQQSLPFSDKDINFIHQHAHGDIKQINLLAHQVLLKKYTRKNRLMNIPSLEKLSLPNKPKIWISLAIAIILSTVLFFQSKINQLIESQPDSEPILAKAVSTQPEKKDYLLKKIPDSHTVKTDIAKKYIPPSDRSHVTAAPSLSLETTEKPPEPADTDNIINTIPEPVNTVITNHPPEQTVSNEKNIDNSLTKLLEKHQIQDKTWIMKLPASSASAQIMASIKLNALIRQANYPELKGKVAIYKILRNNRDWYVMVYGSYKNITTLRQAVNKLPATLKKRKPWLRYTQAIQAEILAGKK